MCKLHFHVAELDDSESNTDSKSCLLSKHAVFGMYLSHALSL